jgi:hypothetical protein
MTQADSRLWTRVDPTNAAVIRARSTQLPIPIAAIGNDLGLEIKLVALEPNISGEIRPSPTAPSGFKIRINRHDKKARQRFTAAHEVAHFLLHADRIGNGIADNVLYRSTLSNEIEWEANRLAADILMPRELIRAELEKLGGIPTLDVAEQMAEIFEVSLPAMKIRIGIE